MSFHLTAQDIRVENNHILVGKLQNQAGDYVESSIDLNRFLGNNNGDLFPFITCSHQYREREKRKLTIALSQLGHFEWFGHNFAQTAHGVHFAIEGGGHVPVLRAELTNLQNERVGGDVNLSEHVVNVNGHFEFQ